MMEYVYMKQSVANKRMWLDKMFCMNKYVDINVDVINMLVYISWRLINMKMLVYTYKLIVD